MKSYEICEVVRHYHCITVEDDVNIEKVVENANDTLSRHDTGYEAIEDALSRIKEQFGFDFEIKKNYCGTVSEGLSVMDEVD